MAAVLVVDDHDRARSTIREILETRGHEVREASSAAECFSAMEESAAELAIVDIVMPGKSGTETITDLKRLYPELRIIAISGYAEGSEADDLGIVRQYGANGLLPKPFATRQLFDMVDAVLAQGEEDEE